MFADEMSEAGGRFADQSQAAPHCYWLRGRSPITGPSNNHLCPRARWRDRESTAVQLHLLQATGWGLMSCRLSAAGHTVQGNRQVLAAYPAKR